MASDVVMLARSKHLASPHVPGVLSSMQAERPIDTMLRLNTSCWSGAKVS